MAREILDHRIDLIVRKICPARNHLIHHLLPFSMGGSFGGDHRKRMAHDALLLNDWFARTIGQSSGACSGRGCLGGPANQCQAKEHHKHN